MKGLIKSLYPVKYDDMVYIWSGNSKMLMDIHVRIRGWGWMQYLTAKLYSKNNNWEIQNEIGQFIAQAINEKIERDYNIRK